MGYIYIFSALILLVMYFIANKLVQKRLGSGPAAALSYSCIRNFISALIMFMVYAFMFRGAPKLSGFSVTLAVLLSVFVCAYTIVGFRILGYGSVSVFTVFLMLGGMILPYIYGIIWLGEGTGIFRIIGIVLMVISLFFPLIGGTADGVNRTRREKIVFGLLCFLVFILNGAVSIVSKMHAVKMSDKLDVLISFVFMCAFSNAVLSLCALGVLRFISYRKAKMAGNIASKDNLSEAAGSNAADSFATDGSVTDDSTADGNVSENAVDPVSSLLRKVLPLIALTAIFDGVSFFFQQLGAGQVPASVMYPIMTGGSIVLSSLAGYIIFKEKLSKFAIIGLIITFASTFLFLF